MTFKISLERQGFVMLIGYARTSALEQEAGLEAQMRDLEALGCDRIFAEQTSSVAARKALRGGNRNTPVPVTPLWHQAG